MAISISISITQNSQNITNNTSNVTVKVNAKWTYGSYNKLQKSGYLIIDGTKYAFTSSFNTGQSTSGSQTLFTKTVDVTHGSTGAKTLSCSASYTSGVSSGTVTASASKVLTTIARKSTLSVSGTLTLGKSIEFDITRQSTSLKHKLTYKCGSETGYILGSSSTAVTTESIGWIPSIEDFAELNTTGTTLSFTFTLTTYNGNSKIGTDTKTISCSIPSSVKPSVSITVTDATGYKDTYGGYVQGLSKFKIVLTEDLTNARGATIKARKVTADGKTYTSATTTTAVISGKGSLTISATITDTRGRTATASATVNVLAYAAPLVSALTVKRSNASGGASSTGEYLTVVFSSSITALSNKNTAAYTVKYKKTTESNYTETTLTNYAGQYSITNGAYTFAADVASSYDVILTVKDAFSSTLKAGNGSSIKKIWSVLKDGLGFAFGKIAELENVLDIGFQTRFTGGILHPVLVADTDFNDVRTPNTYVGLNASSNNYSNCPIDTGTFTLEVLGMGNAGQVKQRLSECIKTEARIFERIYYSGTWGDWVCVSDYAGTLLWSGGLYMTAGHTATLSETVNKQPNGIVLVFSEYYDGEAKNHSFHREFVSKKEVALHGGAGSVFAMCSSSLAYFATKYLYISNDKISGHANNNQTITGTCGITATNNRFVLRYVIGV